MLATGIRVVRGPDWAWDEQDGGEGHVGTVREIGRLGSSNTPEKTVVVNWDSGNRTNYRIGYQDKYDLIVVDNAQIGVKHPNIICDGCSKAGIAGIRFRCSLCNNFDLCAMCYGNDIHDLDHPFIRYQTVNSAGVRVPLREGSVKLQLKGIFVGAKVCRGPDWEWSNQDGGEDKTGRVMEIRGWDNESCRSVANVAWDAGSVNVYRLGHQGNVDLKYVQPGVGGYYYRDHMPVLGQTEEEEQQQQQQFVSTRPFVVGDRVKIAIDLGMLVKLQKGHGGWNPRMEQFITKIGTVHRITDKGDIRVQYENCANRWTIHPAALTKVYVFHVGDIVTISGDVTKVQALQRGHGEWVDIMRNALGKMGKVIKVYDDGDLRIQEIESGRTWTLNPHCVKLERSHVASAAERSNSMMDLSHQRADHVMLPLSGLSGTSAADKVVREAAQGKLDYVKNYLSVHPEQVDVMSGGKTCLQVAAHQGHINLVRYLLSHGASVNQVDKEGDSTLHYAAFGNQPDIMRILLQNGGDIDVLNGSHCSALHISAHKKPPHCVKVLLEFGADINVQDSYGDTALHDAIGKENTEVVELLCSTATLDLTVRNKRGFNALHHASLKGNAWAARRILQVARHLVDAKKEDGFAPLHLAALNGHATVVEVLIQEGHAEIDIRNKRRQTPFLLAVSQGHTSVIEKLIALGCDVLAKDEDGDNAINLTIIKKSNLQQEVNALTAPRMYEIHQRLAHVASPCERLMYTIITFLVESGCRVEPNSKGMLVFEFLSDKTMRDFVLSHKPVAADSSEQETSSAGQNDLAHSEIPGGAGDESISVSLTPANITSSMGSSSSVTTSRHSNHNLQTSGGLNESGEMTDELAGPEESAAVGGAPVTPLRRNRPGAGSSNANVMLSTTRDTATPSPSLNTDEQGAESGTATGFVATPKKMLNSGGCISPPPINRLHVNPTIPPPIPPIASSSMANIGGQGGNNQGVSNNNNNIIASQSSSTNIGPPPISGRSGDALSVKKISNSALQQALPKECIVCNEMVILLLFDPCGHQIACSECGRRMKKCLTCGTLVEHRIDLATGHDVGVIGNAGGGKGVVALDIGASGIGNVNNNYNKQHQATSADRLRYLESKIMEIEETHCCSICMERRRNVAFLCGHSACSKCAETLKTCHMCRKSIVKKINLY